MSKTQRMAGQVEGSHPCARSLLPSSPSPPDHPRGHAALPLPTGPPLASVSGTGQGLSLWIGPPVAGHFWLKLTGQVETTVVGKAMWEQGLVSAVGKEAGHGHGGSAGRSTEGSVSGQKG